MELKEWFRNKSFSFKSGAILAILSLIISALSIVFKFEIKLFFPFIPNTAYLITTLMGNQNISIPIVKLKETSLVKY